MTAIDIDYNVMQPDQPLFKFVKAFWRLSNPSDNEKPVTIVPDGCFDVLFSISATEPFHVILAGLGTEPGPAFIAPHTVTCAVNFKLPAAEYVLKTSIAPLLNGVHYLPADFWGITPADLDNFGQFCKKASAAIAGAIHEAIDPRKYALFQLMYASEGESTVRELAEAAQWSSRQINRYFQQWFGMSLKAYCNILRYRASFKQIQEGKLFPEQDFVDQAHFIKAVKRYSGVTPKELARNKDDRFIQFFRLPEQ
ncbi:AraC family transcriptional regulator [Spirosoma sp. SC4-14]|uniref:AraC family transcriptional regulator n=1 Tax=Spirosoma sp. SC4-14 TaxID=3128900 RepID=UPI0030D15C01